MGSCGWRFRRRSERSRREGRSNCEFGARPRRWRVWLRRFRAVWRLVWGRAVVAVGVAPHGVKHECGLALVNVESHAVRTGGSGSSLAAPRIVAHAGRALALPRPRAMPGRGPARTLFAARAREGAEPERRRAIRWRKALERCGAIFWNGAPVAIRIRTIPIRPLVDARVEAGTERRDGDEDKERGEANHLRQVPLSLGTGAFCASTLLRSITTT